MWSRQALDDEGRRAIHEAITWSTIVLGPSRPVPVKKFTHGMGVCVEYAGRPFVLTAGHVVDELKKLGFSPAEFAIGTRSPEPLTMNFTGRILNRVRGVARSEAKHLPFSDVSRSPSLDDLAILHLAGAAVDFAPLRFHVLQKDRVSPGPGEGVYVVGSPSQEIDWTNFGRGELAVFGTYALEAFVVEYHEELLVRYPDHTFVPGHHYLVDFEAGGETDDYLQSPEGMSGGGIWFPPPPVARD